MHRLKQLIKFVVDTGFFFLQISLLLFVFPIGVVYTAIRIILLLSSTLKIPLVWSVFLIVFITIISALTILFYLSRKNSSKWSFVPIAVLAAFLYTNAIILILLSPTFLWMIPVFILLTVIILHFYRFYFFVEVRSYFLAFILLVLPLMIVFTTSLAVMVTLSTSHLSQMATSFPSNTTLGSSTSTVVAMTTVTSIPTPTMTLVPTPTPIASLTYVVYQSEVTASGSTERTAKLSLNSLGMGDLQMIAPSEIDFLDTGVIRLSINPDSSLVTLEAVAVPVQNAQSTSTALNYTDRISIYPVMRAEILSNEGFNVVSDGKPEKPILSDSPTEWIWTAKPLREGRHSLIIVLTVPVKIDGVEQELSTTLRNIPLEILVIKSVTQRIGEGMPIATPALISLLGVIITLYANGQIQAREKKVQDLQNQLATGAAERQQLNDEISRLRSIPKWQFWRK
jgi:hypothetical protein